MSQLEESLKEIFELDHLDKSLNFKDLDEWDSLASLSVIAMADSDYGVTLTNDQLINFTSIQEFCDYVDSNKTS